ncbi:hypothetical protein BD414DRAFT_466320 [Trametes punicea]|nr:hypothetical protein BD414DRAFT_466320 [Trametes punicea]
MAAAEVMLSPKLARAICEYLAPGSMPKDGSAAVIQRRKRQHALAQLARVCRAMSGIALDVLWSAVDDFSHLLFVFKPYDRDKYNSCRLQMFTDALTNVDWIKFQEHALRVRELHLGDINKIHSTVWILMTQRFPHGPLLPRLERLTGFKIDSNSLSYATLFSPTIRHLELEVEGEAEPGIVRMVVQAAQPTLASTLTLILGEPEHTYPERPPDVAFWRSTQLHTLKLTQGAPLTIEAIKSLASFPNLRVLHLWISSMPDIREDEKFPGFASLRELALTGRVGDMCAFFAATTPPSLDSLSIKAERLCATERSRKGNSYERSERSMEPICASLTPSLRRFRAMLLCDCTTEYHFPDSEKVLRPLSAAAGLRSVSFTFKGGKFHMSDASLAAVEHAWPELLEFEVTTRPAPPRYHDYGGYRPMVTVPVSVEGYSSSPLRNTNDHPTIKTLALFASAHPALERLIVPSIDLDALPDLDTVPLLEHKLRHFSVCTLAGGVGLLDYAIALDMLFPSLNLAAARGKTAAHDDDSTTTVGQARSDELQLLLLALQTGRTGEYRKQGTSAHRNGPAGIRLVLRGRHLETRTSNAGSGSATRPPSNRPPVSPRNDVPPRHRSPCSVVVIPPSVGGWNPVPVPEHVPSKHVYEEPHDEDDMISSPTHSDNSVVRL